MMFPKKKRIKSRSEYEKYGQNNPHCQVCGSLAVDVHHIIPKAGVEMIVQITLCPFAEVTIYRLTGKTDLCQKKL